MASKFVKIVLLLFMLSRISVSAEAAELQSISAQVPAKNIVQTTKPLQGVTSAVAVSPTVPQLVSFENCSKKFNVPSERLFFLTLASINANKFDINEIQSKSGYILFTAANRQFLAAASEVNSKMSCLKIVPADNNYYFPFGVVTNMFKYVELNISTPIEKLN